MREYSCISHFFGIALSEARKSINCSQEGLAELAGIDKSYVSLLEQGKRQPSVAVLFKLSDALDISPSHLIKILEKEVPKILEKDVEQKDEF